MKFLAGFPRALRRVGLITRLLLVALGAVLASVVLVQAWTAQTVRSGLLDQQLRQLDASLTLLHQRLAPLGTEWRLDQRGLALGDTPLAGRNDIPDAVKSVTGAVATIFQADTRIATNVLKPDGARAVGTKLAPGPAFDAVIGAGQTYRGQNLILGTPHLTVYEPLRDAGGRPVGILFVGVPLAPVEAAADAVAQRAVVGAVAVAVAVGLLLLLAMRWLLWPLRALAGDMSRIAGGDLAVTVRFADRRDHLGQMARALDGLRAASAAGRAAQAAADEARDRLEADKRRAQADAARAVEAVADAVATQVASASTRLTDIAGAMAAAAAHAGDNARQAAGAAEAALDTIGGVAVAAEELTAAIGAIAGHVRDSSRAAGDAVSAGQGTREAIDALTARVARIGAVAGMIAEIASRTNLLALNATIEAARAGDAGKGFAVVASEVKQLAAQTARATDEIAGQLNEVRGATETAVAAVARIGGIVSGMGEVADSIAAAVTQQDAAVARIGGLIADTRAGARAVVARVVDVAADSDRTGVQATAVREGATGLAETVAGLRQTVAEAMAAEAMAASPARRAA